MSTFEQYSVYYIDKPPQGFPCGGFHISSIVFVYVLFQIIKVLHKHFVSEILVIQVFRYKRYEFLYAYSCARRYVVYPKHSVQPIFSRLKQKTATR